MTMEEKKLVWQLKRYYSGVKNFNFKDAVYTKYTGPHDYEYEEKIEDFEKWMEKKVKEPGIQGLDTFDNSYTHHQVYSIEDNANSKFKWTYELIKNDNDEIAECLIKVSLKINGTYRVVTCALFRDINKYTKEEQLLLDMKSRANEINGFDIFKHNVIKKFLEMQVEDECSSWEDEFETLDKMSVSELKKYIWNKYDNFLGAPCEMVFDEFEMLEGTNSIPSYSFHKSNVVNFTLSELEQEFKNFVDSAINPLNVYINDINNLEQWGGFENDQYMPIGDSFMASPFVGFNRYNFIDKNTFETVWERKENNKKTSFIIHYKYTLPFESKFLYIKSLNKSQTISFEVFPINYYKADDYKAMIRNRFATDDLLIIQDIYTKRFATEYFWFVRKSIKNKEQVMSATEFLTYSEGTLEEQQSPDRFFDLVNVINLGLKVFKVKVQWKEQEGVDILVNTKLVYELEDESEVLVEYQFNHIFYNKKSIKHFTSEDENGNIITHAGGEVTYE